MKHVSMLGAHLKAARQSFPEGGTLTCDWCNATHRMTVGDAARYLEHGWPKCCGETMRLDVKPASRD